MHLTRQKNFSSSTCSQEICPLIMPTRSKGDFLRDYASRKALACEINILTIKSCLKSLEKWFGVDACTDTGCLYFHTKAKAY